MCYQILTAVAGIVLSVIRDENGSLRQALLEVSYVKPDSSAILAKNTKYNLAEINSSSVFSFVCGRDGEPVARDTIVWARVM
ncbi:hypothetical protein TNCV_568871 [Trichonephila clavipes]|nr:hypothetical protein TNCV_568871 [Trichonephila clavipes]